MSTNPPLDFIVNLRVDDMKKNSFLQNAVWEPEDMKWYLAQAVNAGPRDMEHTYIRRFSWKGAYEGYCKLNLWGHGNQIGVRKSASGNVWVWVPMDSYNSAGSTTRTRASRVIWRKGEEYTRKESASVDIFNVTWATQCFSPSFPLIYVRKGKASTEEYYKVNEEQFRTEKAKPLDKLVASKKGRGKYFQGCTADKDYVFVLSGSTNKNQYIDVYSWKQNKKITRITLTPAYLKAKFKKLGLTYSSVEGEGLYTIAGELYVGVRSGPAGSKRDFAIFYIDW